MVVTDWNLARYLRQSYFIRKYKKIDIDNLIVVAL